MKKIILALSSILMLFMFCACSGADDATFSGSKTGNENHYEKRIW